MLSKMTKITCGPLRLLYGVIALAILITAFSPVAASAAVRRDAPKGTQATYVNLAHATSRWNWFTDYSLKFQLRQSYASTINADDSAMALTSGCHDCGATAIGFQVIFAPKQSLSALNVNSAAQATSTSCVRCSTLAEVYQIVDISTTEQQLTYQQLAGLEYVRFEFEALRFPGLSSDQVQSRVTELADQAIAILQNSTADPPARYVPSASPAINDSALNARMTGDSQPGVELFVKIQSA